MPITPLSTPLTMEYKPLGLEAFAVPLSKLQEKFDLTKNEIDKTKYALNTLAPDDERASKLLGELDTKTKELSENLTRTGNFKEAANKLQELNNFYNTNPELGAYKKRYESYKAAYDEMEELRKDPKNNLSAEDVKKWNYYVLNKDKGANYDKATGSYDPGDFSPTGPKLHIEMQEKAAELADMAATNQTVAIGRLMDLGISGEEADNLVKRTTKFQDRNQIAKEIFNVLMHIPKYKDFLNKEAEIDFFVANDQTKKRNINTGANPFEFSDQTIENKAIPNLQARLAQEQIIIDNPEQFSEEQITQAEINKQELIEEFENIQGAHANRFNDPETYEDIAEAYFKVDALGYLGSLSQSTADLIDMVQDNLSYSSSGGVTKNQQDKIDAIGNITYSVGQVSSTKAPKVSGGVSTYMEEVHDEIGIEGFDKLFVENETNMKNNLATEAYKTVSDAFGVPQKIKVPDMYRYTDLPDFYKNEANIHAMDKVDEAYTRRIEEIEGEIADYNTKLSELSPGSLEHKEMSSKLITAYNDRNQTLYAKTYEYKDLDFLTNQLFTIIDKSGIVNATKDNLEEKISDVQKQVERFAGESGYKFDNFTQGLLARYERYKERNPGKAEERLISDFKDLMNLWNSNKSNTSGLFHKIQEKSLEGVTLPISLSAGENENEFKVEFTNEMFKSDDAHSLVLSSIFDNFKKSKTLGSEGYVQIPQVLYDKGLDAFTNGQMGEVLKHVKNTGPEVSPAVTWDPVKRESALSKHQNYIIGAYLPNPTIIGRDQNGGFILKYTLNPINRKGNSGYKTYIANIQSGMEKMQSTDLEDKTVVLDEDNQKYFSDNNPNELYISVRRMSVDPTLEAEKNYVDLVTTGINSYDLTKGVDIVEQQRNNFAPLWLVNNKDRAFEYTQFAKTLSENAKAGIVSSQVQGAAYEKDLGDNKYEGYHIMYKTTRDNKIVAQPVRTIKQRSTEKGVPDKILEKTELPAVNVTLGNNLPLSLLKMDMTFGTGNERDLITTRQGGFDVPFVIAFLDGMLSTDPYASREALTKIVN